MNVNIELLKAKFNLKFECNSEDRKAITIYEVAPTKHILSKNLCSNSQIRSKESEMEKQFSS